MKTTAISKGFSLIEVLVVMVIIGILVSILLPNVVGMRNRARDSRVKAELNHLKTALQMYYSDFQAFPAAGVGTNIGMIMGCGDGNEACSWGGRFSATVDGLEKVYMEQLPNVTDGIITYTQPDDDQSYLMGATLENASDADIEASIVRCNLGEEYFAAAAEGDTTYFVCP